VETVPKNEVVTWARACMAAALTTLLFASTACGPPDSDQPEPVPAEKDVTLAACEEHFPDVRDYEPETVGGVRNIGPAVIDGPAEPLDVYADDEPVALCLVPNGTGTFDAVAVILSDGNTVIRWSVNVEDLGARPA